MARAATTTDVFNAIAEPRRREIIGILNDGGELAVNDVVLRLKLPQPAVSKHLGVLRKVGVVTVVKRGQHRLYRLNGAQLKQVHDWVKVFEQYWTDQINRIKERAEQKAVERILRAGEKRKQIPHSTSLRAGSSGMTTRTAKASRAGEGKQIPFGDDN